MAIRIKSQWFSDKEAKTTQQSASVMAFIVFRVAVNALKEMRAAQFDIDVGAQYFRFVREFLAFLAAATERLAYRKMDGADRAEFITAMVLRIAEILAENEEEFLGNINQADSKRSFVMFFNERAADYAQFGDGQEGPDFLFLRYLGHRIMDIVPDKDRAWVVDQVMQSAAPDAVASIEAGMRGLFDPVVRARGQHVMSGD